MKITSQEEFGLRCLLRLAHAADGGHSLTIPEIAAAEGMSPPYVAKILAILRQGGLVESVRGRAGGYRLAGAPADFTVAAVMKVLGEPLFEDPAYCQQHAGSEANGLCVHHGACSLRALWHTLEGWMQRTLEGVTLADLVQGGGRITEVLRSRLADAVLEPAAPSSLINLTMVTK
jgi:Rrf2 family transcriptional regulator, iron-sulfur cluster assembly transcription factor